MQSVLYYTGATVKLHRGFLASFKINLEENILFLWYQLKKYWQTKNNSTHNIESLKFQEWPSVI